MSKTKSRGGSCSPFGCMFVIIGLGFLVSGIVSGTVASQLRDLQANPSLSSPSLTAVVIWAAITFVTLGLGLLSVWFGGLRDSFMGFGVLLILISLAGIAVHFSELQVPSTGNEIWDFISYLNGLTGSLLISSIGLGGIGLLVVVMVLFMGGEKEDSTQQRGGNRQILICAHCEQPNPVWYAFCEKCGEQLIMAQNNDNWNDFW